MTTTACTGIQNRSRLRWLATSLVLGLGLTLAAAPGYCQETEEAQVTGGKKRHRKRQNQPIKLGTSGSNVEDITAGFCCNGTLGALVEKFGTQYILSNNHVIARSNSAKIGEAIIQPGYSDQSCPAVNPDADTVAHLSAKKKIKFGFDRQNKVDAAIAEVVPGAVRPDGEILKIGVPGNTPAPAFIGMEVKKSGRTTGFTRGVVDAVNVTVEVAEYPLDCAGLETRSARFRNQIVISGLDGKRFGDRGDSGSMVYQDTDVCPAPVGLIFAGNEAGWSFASPASTVLKTIKRLRPRGDARFVGCESSNAEVFATRAPILKPQRVREASDVKGRWEDLLLEIPGVQAVGVGVTLSGPVEPAIWIFSTDRDEEMLGELPEFAGDFRIEVIQTDKVEVHCGQ